MEFPIFIYIPLLLLVALLSTRLMKLFKLPNVTGYIITGIIMGPFVFGLLFNNFTYDGIKESVIYNHIQKISWISTVALSFIAFSIGSSFKKSMIKSVGKRVIVITIFEALGASLLVFISLFTAHLIFPDIFSLELVLTLSAIASATAPAATLMIIKQYKARGSLVDTLLPVVALDDAAALILFAILFQLATAMSSGKDINIYNMLFKPLIEIALSISFGGVIGLFISLLNSLFKSRNNRLVLCIIATFLSVGLNVLFKNKVLGGFELSSLLMSMVSGALYINLSKDNDKTFDLLDRFTSPLYTMFFVISGATLDLTIFFNRSGLIVLIIASIYIIFRVFGKYIGAYFGSSVTRSEKKIRRYLGLTLIPQAGVAIGLATTASTLFSQNETTKEVGALIIAVILTSTLVYELSGPLISKYALSKAGDIPQGA